MFPFPKLSAPLIKDIRTGEGIAEWALGLGVSVLTAVGDLGVVKGATFLTIIAGLKGIRRGLIKLVSLQNGAGIGAPLEPKFITGVAGATATWTPKIETALSEISDSEAFAAATQSEPGTPAEAIASGLSPDQPSTTAAPAPSPTGGITPTQVPGPSVTP